MAKCAFLSSNRAAGLTPAAGSSTPVTGLGWDKLNDPQPRHRSRVASTSVILIWDLGAGVSIDCAALISTNIEFADTVRVRASLTDATVTGSLLHDSGANSGVAGLNGNVIEVMPAPITARYVRWDITASNPIDIGLAPVSLLSRPGRNFAFGAQHGFIDLAVRDKNPDTGADFTIGGPLIRTYVFTIEGLASNEVLGALIGTLDITVTARGDVLFIPDPDASRLDLGNQAIWGSYRSVGGSDLNVRTAAQRWTRSFRIIERL